MYGALGLGCSLIYLSDTLQVHYKFIINQVLLHLLCVKCMTLWIGCFNLAHESLGQIFENLFDHNFTNGMIERAYGWFSFEP